MNDSRRIVIGYHGCDQSTFDRIVISGKPFSSSKNDYDWLGSGIYFWQDDPLRAKEFAVEKKYDHPAVIGAVIDLGNCLNLHTRAAIEMLKQSYHDLESSAEMSGLPMPKNLIKDDGGFSMLRKLDCAVIENVHKIREDDPPLDTVLGIFQESKTIYEGAGFMEKTHIQICVRNDERILGVFIPNTRYFAGNIF